MRERQSCTLDVLGYIYINIIFHSYMIFFFVLNCFHIPLMLVELIVLEFFLRKIVISFNFYKCQITFLYALSILFSSFTKSMYIFCSAFKILFIKQYTLYCHCQNHLE